MFKVKMETTPRTRKLEDEFKLLRSLCISMVGRDSEGAYRPEFVAEALAATREKALLRFTTTKKFLADLNAV